MTSTHHARRRMNQRGIRREAIDFTLRWGAIYHRTGIVFHVLRRRDIERSRARDPEVSKWEGTTVLTSGETIISVYKNRDVSHIRRKSHQDLAVFFGSTAGAHDRLAS